MKETIMLEEIKKQPDLLMRTIHNNADILPKIATAIKEFKPSNILIVARGTSLHSGMLAKYLFQIYYHLPVAIAAPAVFTVYDSDVDLSNTLVIAISQSGKAKDICKVVEKARNSNALTIGITNTHGSIIADACEYNLYNDVDEAVSYAATKTYTSTLYLLLELLYQLTKHEDLLIEEHQLKAALESGLSYHNEIKELVKDLEHAKNTLVMTRGKYLTLAMELALKMKETSHYPVDAYPCSEFYHGPIVATSEATPAILFAIDPVTNDNIKKMVDDLKSLNAYTLVITNDSDIATNATKALILKQDNLYALFEAAVVLQLYANELSILRGNNPDFHSVLEHIETI